MCSTSSTVECRKIFLSSLSFPPANACCICPFDLAIEQVIYRVSVAAAPLAAWVKANMAYSKVLEKVAPLESELSGLQSSIEESAHLIAQYEQELHQCEQQVRGRAGRAAGRGGRVLGHEVSFQTELVTCMWRCACVCSPSTEAFLSRSVSRGAEPVRAAGALPEGKSDPQRRLYQEDE